jgi:[ribosomal protein S5]-alanine N-acetyltransferase
VSSDLQVCLLPATEPLLIALTDDRARFGELIGSAVPDGWPEFPEAVGFTLEYLENASDADRAWSMQFFVEPATGQLLGSGGFAAPPAEGTVEIGYEIAPEFRGLGLGTAATRALVDRALASSEVDHVLARTLPGPNPSTGVLVSLGFEHTGEHEDPEVGVAWEWRRTR